MVCGNTYLLASSPRWLVAKAGFYLGRPLLAGTTEGLHDEVSEVCSLHAAELVIFQPVRVRWCGSLRVVSPTVTK